jgi:hypothetical protein
MASFLLKLPPSESNVKVFLEEKLVIFEIAPKSIGRDGVE